MIFREAIIADIPQMQIIRNAVKENQLSNPDIVKDKDYECFLLENGKGWVCEIENLIVGFAIVDLVANNIWALFVDPEFENQGIGKQLHNLMLNWYFKQAQNPVWLGTAPGTRAADFYRFSGWKEIGTFGKEIKFEMTYKDWNNL
ncbi:GNAT family N-acetyltransferase [Epilithonimonas sp.]|uniref:GNAT family N-acetyltransferase n=1 Tax=Epilithonimonas sp. TaxID=2894511 RepID=UPI0035B116D3